MKSTIGKLDDGSDVPGFVKIRDGIALKPSSGLIYESTFHL